MTTIEKFKPVKHLHVFEEMFDQALIDLQEATQKNIDDKKRLIMKHKKACVFKKNIYMYKSNDELIGFCMYGNTEQYETKISYVIFDFVNKKFKGKGRCCREKIVKTFSTEADELKFTIDENNFLSNNSIKRLDQKLANTGLGVLKVTPNEYFGSKIDYTFIYY